MRRAYSASVAAFNVVWLFTGFGWLAATIGVLMALAYHQAVDRQGE